jgi:hypothetical protein
LAAGEVGGTFAPLLLVLLLLLLLLPTVNVLRSVAVLPRASLTIKPTWFVDGGVEH